MGWILSGEGPDAEPIGAAQANENAEAADLSLASTDETVVQPKDAGARLPAVDTGPESPIPIAETARLTFECVAIETGEPLAGIGITLDVDDRSIVPHAQAKERLSDAHGRLSFDVPTGVLIQLQAWGETVAAGLVLGEFGPYEPGQEALERLEHVTAIDVIFHGRIVDEDSGGPVSGVTIDPMIDSEIDLGIARATSDANGVFRLEVPSWRTSWFWATSTGRGRISLHPKPGHETSSNALELRMPRESQLRGHVRHTDGSPARGVEVVARNSSRDVVRPEGHPCDFSWAQEARAEVDASGAYELNGLTANGRYELALEEDGQLAQAGEDVWFEPGEERVLDWALLGKTTIAGTLVDQNGRPGSSVRMWLVPTDRPYGMRFTTWQAPRARAIWTDTAGHFRFEGVPQGLWLVGPARSPDEEGEVFAPRGTLVEVTGLEPELNVDLVVWRNLSLQGLVIDESGEPVPDVTVSVHSDTGNTHSVRTDDAGRFIAYGLDAETYEFTVGGWGYAWMESEPVQADPRDPKLIEIVALRGGRIRGRVLASNGKPAQGFVHVAGRTVGEETPDWTRVFVRIEGTYELSGLEPGTYDLLARSETGEVATAFDVRVERTPEPTVVDLRLVESGTLVLVADEDGGPESMNATFFLDTTFAGHGATMGSKPFEIALPAGRLEIVIEDSLDRTLRRTVEIRAGERTEVRVEAP